MREMANKSQKTTVNSVDNTEDEEAEEDGEEEAEDDDEEFDSEEEELSDEGSNYDDEQEIDSKSKGRSTATKKAAAALCVNVGSLSDSKEMQVSSLPRLMR